MMKRFFLLLISILLLLPAAAAAKLEIFRPYDGQTLHSNYGAFDIHFELDDRQTELYVCDEQGNVLFSAMLNPSMSEATINSSSKTLKEGQCYFLLLKQGKETVSSRFYVSYSYAKGRARSLEDRREYFGTYALGKISSPNVNMTPESDLLMTYYNDYVARFKEDGGTGIVGKDQEYDFLPSPEYDAVADPSFTADTQESSLLSALLEGVYLFDSDISFDLGHPDGMLGDFANLFSFLSGHVQPSVSLNDASSSEQSSVSAPVSPAMSQALENPENIHVESLHFQHVDGLDIMICVLLDENKQPIDGKPYLAFRFFSGPVGHLCIIDDEELVAQYLASSSKPFVPSSGSGFLLNVPNDLSIRPVTMFGSTETGLPVSDAYNKLIEQLGADAPVYYDEECVIDYNADPSKEINPMILVLSGESSSGRGDYNALEKDAYRLLSDAAVEALYSELPAPFSDKLAQEYFDDKISYYQLGYALGDTEYIVFALMRDDKPVDDSLLLISRLLSEGGTAHLALFTDQSDIKNIVQDHVANGGTQYSFIPPFELPEEAEPSPYLGTVTREGNSVNIRSGSGTDTSRVGSLKDGESLPVLSITENGWYEVLLPDGSTGFISGGVVDFTSDGGSSAALTPNAGKLTKEDELLSACDRQLDMLINKSGKVSYADAALRDAVSYKDSWPRGFAKALYDVSTDPIGEMLDLYLQANGIDSDMYRQRLMEDVLRDMLLDASENTAIDTNIFTPASEMIGKTNDVLNMIDDLIPESSSFAYTNLLTGAKNTLGHGASVIAFLVDQQNVEARKDQRYAQVYELLNDYELCCYLLDSIRTSCSGEPLLVNACTSLQKELDDALIGVFDEACADAGDETMYAFSKQYVPGVVSSLIAKLGTKAMTSHLGAVLFAGKSGELLTNQTSVISDEVETLLCLHQIDSTVSVYAQRAINTEDSYAYMELVSALKKRELEESRKYYNAYTHTASGLYQSLVGNYDGEYVDQKIGEQIEFVTNNRNALRAKARTALNLRKKSAN